MSLDIKTSESFSLFEIVVALDLLPSPKQMRHGGSVEFGQLSMALVCGVNTDSVAWKRLRVNHAPSTKAGICISDS